jgi:type IV secretion system protein VirD4
LPNDQALVLLAGTKPIRAKKLRYFEDDNFTARLIAAPVLAEVVREI